MLRKNVAQRNIKKNQSKVNSLSEYSKRLLSCIITYQLFMNVHTDLIIEKFTLIIYNMYCKENLRCHIMSAHV